MKRLLAALLALMLPDAAMPKDAAAAHEASMNFDKKNVVPFLQVASKIFESGFGATEVKKIEALMDKMKLDEEKELTFSVKFKEQTVSLRVRLFMDDIDAIDLYMFSTVEVTERLNAQMKKFAEERGL